MKQSEALDWAMRGVIELMGQEQDEKKKEELNLALKLLAVMFIESEREEVKRQFYTCGRNLFSESLLDALKAMQVPAIRSDFEKWKKFGIIYIDKRNIKVYPFSKKFFGQGLLSEPIYFTYLLSVKNSY